MTNNLSLSNIKEELVVFARNADVFTTTQRGVTTASQNFTATSGQTTFNLTNFPVQNIRTVTDDGSPLYLITDYTVNYTTGVVTMNTGITLNHTVAFSYDYKTSTAEKIYPDLPRTDITISSMPRMGFDYTSIQTVPFSLNASSEISKMIVSAIVWDTTITAVDGYQSTLRAAVNAAKKSFQTFPYIHPIGVGPMLRSKGSDERILHRTQDFEIKFAVERV